MKGSTNMKIKVFFSSIFLSGIFFGDFLSSLTLLFLYKVLQFKGYTS